MTEKAYRMDQAAILNDPTRWEEFSKPDIELQQMIEGDIQPRLIGPRSASEIHEVRERWHPLFRQDADELLSATGGTVTETEIFIPVRDGSLMRALVYRSKSVPNSGKPLIVMLHGGGFCLGNAEMEAAGCISAVQAYDCVSMSLEYRMAPEIRFPIPWEDCWDAIRWLSDNASSLGANLFKGFVLGGTSAGGHLAIPLIHKARDEKLSPPITGVYLNVTPALAPQAVPDKYQYLYRSRQVLSNGLSLTSKSIDMYDQVMVPEFSSPLWSPLLWPTGHGDLPPHFFQICGADMLRDEALIYERELKQNHVKTEVIVYQGLPHVFWYDYPSHSVSKRFVTDITRGLGWLLGRE
ncbi:Alpha/Beta hydrolase protein, partial [Ilyonectria destructans]